jgi:hypothetical protein
MTPEQMTEKQKQAIQKIAEPVSMHVNVMAQSMGIALSEAYCKGYEDGQNARLVVLPFRN